VGEAQHPGGVGGLRALAVAVPAELGRHLRPGRESQTVDEVAYEVRVFGDRIADLAVTRTVDGLPERLFALWNDGVPLDGSDVRLATNDRRRAALHAFWASRTETSWGDTVREAIARFCRGVVQTSDHPFPPSELERLNALDPHRPFLTTPSADSNAEADAP
jgi:hypothetical protein